MRRVMHTRFSVSFIAMLVQDTEHVIYAAGVRAGTGGGGIVPSARREQEGYNSNIK